MSWITVGRPRNGSIINKSSPAENFFKHHIIFLNILMCTFCLLFRQHFCFLSIMLLSFTAASSCSFSFTDCTFLTRLFYHHIIVSHWILHHGIGSILSNHFGNLHTNTFMLISIQSSNCSSCFFSTATSALNSAFSSSASSSLGGSKVSLPQ